MTARSFCDAAISLDADLQDDINAMDAMLQKFQDGCDIVYGVRSDRETDTVFKDTINSCPAWAANWSTTMLTTGS